jgi:hypothetical protein
MSHLLHEPCRPSVIAPKITLASYRKRDFTGARLRDSVPLVHLFIEHNDAVTVGEAISEITAYLFTCGPLVLALAAWVRIFQTRRLGWPGTFSFVALLVVTANAGFAAGTTLYFDLSGRSTYSPPWQNKEILNLAMLFFLAPIGMALGYKAAKRGAPKSPTWTLQLASAPLFLIGFLRCVSV